MGRDPTSPFAAAAGAASAGGRCSSLLLAIAGLLTAVALAAAEASTRSARRATSRRCRRSGSGRTRSSTRPTVRCSARSRPSATGRSCRSRASAPGCRRRRSRSRTGASTRTAAIDPQGIARAVVADAKARSVVQGGSTITQQLVRNLYISNERTVQRKLKEACLAIKLNDAWSKERILESYLNQVYYGNLAYGIEAAAQTYFSKPARALNLRESALLAGLTQAPSAYDPFVEPAKALARRNAVLDAMRDQGVITEKQYALGPPARATSSSSPGRLYKEIQRAVLLRLRARPADPDVRRPRPCAPAV